MLLQKANSKLWTKKLKQIWYRHILRKSSKIYQNIIEEDPDHNEAIDDNHANELLEEKLAGPLLTDPLLADPLLADPLLANSASLMRSSIPANNLDQNTYWTLAMSENGNLFHLYYLKEGSNTTNSAANHVIIVPYL